MQSVTAHESALSVVKLFITSHGWVQSWVASPKLLPHTKLYLTEFYLSKLMIHGILS